MADPTIVFTRIDNRLVHGQVGMVWATSIDCNLIVVVDDDAANDKVQQKLMKMTADSIGVGIRFFSTQQAIDTLFKASPKQKIFIVARNPATVRKLVESKVPIKKCNIGNMHFSEGKKVYKESHVYLGDQDKKDLQAIKDKGVDVFVQITPGDRRYPFE